MTLRRRVNPVETGANIYDVAQKAQVSTATVSRVLNGNPKVDPELRKKVLTVVQELKYIPNGSARSLVTKQTKRIALLISDITNPFFAQTARGAQDTLDQHGYQLLLANSDNQPSRELRYLTTFAQTGVDGILIEPAISDRQSLPAQRTMRRALSRQLERLNLPVVGLTPDTVMPLADSVSIDEELAAFKAVEHLLGLGHREIALINGPQLSTSGMRRAQGYERALKHYRVEFELAKTHHSHFDRDTGFNGTKQLLQQYPKISAIFAADELIATGVLRAARELKRQVPQDLAVISIADAASTADFYPPLSVVAHPRGYEFGRLGSQLLLERILATAPREASSLVLETRLIVRSSTVLGISET